MLKKKNFIRLLYILKNAAMSSATTVRRQKRRAKYHESEMNGEPVKPTKEEKAVTSYLKGNLKVRDGICVGSEMKYFVGSKAVDLLMSSKWASASSKKDDDVILFPNRQAAVDYCYTLLEKDMFRRVFRVRRQRPGGDKKDRIKKERKEKKDDTDANEDKVESAENVEKEESSEKKSKRPRKPAKLEPHEEQVFIDGGDAVDALYVWIYDPVTTRGYLIGLAVIVGAIAACLYPLWPMELRLGVYYICLGLLGLLGLLIALAVVRGILFCGVWLGTMGKKYFWLYPNLFADCGFFESFQPTYSMTIPSEAKSKKAKAKQLSQESKSEQADDEKEKTNACENDNNQRPPKGSGDESDTSKFEVLQHSDFDQSKTTASDDASDDCDANEM